MILELSKNELMQLIESEKDLSSKVQEAINLINGNSTYTKNGSEFN